MDRFTMWKLTGCLSALLWGLSGGASENSTQPQMTDRAISDKIEDELLADQGVSPVKVDIHTRNGIVTLSGTVGNILAKERSARIAETVKGVRSVLNRIEVKPSAYRTDEEIRKDVGLALLANPATESYEVTPSVKDGIVTLSGTVDSYRERELVQTMVKGVQGVKGIEPKIAVDYKTMRADLEIAEEIKEALRWNVYIDDQLIEVAVDDGKVTLSGTVGSAAEKRLATTESWLAGVKAVDASGLSVERWARDEKLRGNKYANKSPEELRKAVEAALLRDPRVLSAAVEVDVVGSLVTLRGKVSNLKAKRAAEDDARATVGVLAVDNRLKIRTDDVRSDDALVGKIRAALLRDPYVERFEITVTVVDGVAHLYGTVDTAFEKNRADELASTMEGVADVKNRLVVDSVIPQILDPYVDDTYVSKDELIDYERRVPFRSDAQIEARIGSEMWWSPFVDENQVKVTVDDGIATLTGTVDSWSEWTAATENAYEGGATLVDNDLVVSWP